MLQKHAQGLTWQLRSLGYSDSTLSSTSVWVYAGDSRMVAASRMSHSSSPYKPSVSYKAYLKDNASQPFAAWVTEKLKGIRRRSTSTCSLATAEGGVCTAREAALSPKDETACADCRHYATTSSNSSSRSAPATSRVYSDLAAVTSSPGAMQQKVQALSRPICRC